MLLSMTGYGKSEIGFADKKFIIEIKSLNGKASDLNLKLPQSLRNREMELRQTISLSLERGKTDCSIFMEAAEGQALSLINPDTFSAWVTQLKNLSAAAGLKLSDDALVQSVLRMPDLVKTDKSDLREDEWEKVLEGVHAALKQVKAFREQEGKAIEKDFRLRIELMRKLLKEIEGYEKPRIEKLRERLSKNIEELKLNGDLDKNRLEQEIIYYIEKLDITEEKTRLQNHFRYFEETLSEKEAPGRKLSFITQEIGREINTIGSKANDHDIQQRVVGMKDELEKIKEQTANIL